MPHFHYPTWKGSQAFCSRQQRERKRKRLLYMALEGIKPCIKSALMAHIGLSVQQGDNIVRLGSGFLALFGNVDIIVSTLAESVWVSVCHLTVAVIVHIVYRMDELIHLWYLHARAVLLKNSCVFLMQAGRTHGKQMLLVSAPPLHFERLVSGWQL